MPSLGSGTALSTGSPALDQESSARGQEIPHRFAEVTLLHQTMRFQNAGANLRIERRGAVDGFVKICERWGLSKQDQVVLLGYAGNELMAEPVLRNRVRPSQDVLDRTGYLVSISVGLRALFRNSLQEELNWLNRANAKFQGRSPLQTMLTGKMIDVIKTFDLVEYERGLR